MSEENTRNKQLPYKEPPFCTYQYFGSPGVAAMQNPTAYQWYLNHAIVLSCGRRFLTGYTSPDISIYGTRLEEMPFMERIDVKRSFIDGSELDVIRNMIDEGYYVCFNMVDVYYIDGMLWSGEKHSFHDGLICGYDDRDYTLTIAAYDSRWRYTCFKTPQDGLVQAFYSGKEMGGYDNLIGIRTSDNIILPDLTAMAKHLEDYLTPDPYSNSYEGNDNIFGIVVHDYIRLYLTFLHEKEIPYDRMDRRIMRLLWEQKRCMADRISFLESYLGLNSEMSKEYAPVLKSAELCRALYESYRQKERGTLLITIQEELKKMKAIEESLLPRLITAIKSCKKEKENDIMEKN